MNPSDVFTACKIIPVVNLNELHQALPIAELLAAAGFPIMEITLRNPVAFQAFSIIRSAFPELAVGVGTITDSPQIEWAKDAGADFAFSPGWTAQLIATAKQSEMPFIPGVSSVADIMNVQEQGCHQVKFFPAEASGGPDFINSVAGLFPSLEICPTGGISKSNIQTYLEVPNVKCVGASWMINQKHIQNQHWSAIEEDIKEAYLISQA